MPIPVGFEEETATTPVGFEPEDTFVPEISQAPQKGIFDKMISFFKSPERDIAKAHNIYALSEVTGLTLQEVNKHYDILRRSSKVTGITPDLDKKEYAQMAILPAIAVGAVTNPIGTAAGLIAFGALNKVVPTDKFIDNLREQGISDEVLATVELVDFIGKSLLVRGVFKKAPQLVEGFTKQKIVEYKLPETITLSAQQVKDIYQIGKLTTAEQQSLFGSLGLKGAALRGVLKEGVNINIPSAKVITIVDKPFWAKVKGIFGAGSSPKVTTTMVGKPTQAPAGLIEGKVTPAVVPAPQAGAGKPAESLLASAKQAQAEEITAYRYGEEKNIQFSSKNKDYAEEYAIVKGGKPEDVKKITFTARNPLVVELSQKEFADPDIEKKYIGEAKKNGNDVIIFRDRVNKDEFYVQVKGEQAKGGQPPAEPPPTAVSGEPAPEEPSEGDPVKRIIQALKEAKPIRAEQEALMKAERGKRIAKAKAMGEEMGGEAGFYAQLGSLKGKLPKAQFESLRGKITQQDIDFLFDRIRQSEMNDWDKISAQTGLGKIFGEFGGQVPTESELKLLNDVFGKEFTDAVVENRTFLQKFMIGVEEVLNVPRAVMSSFDLSAPFRQGAFFVGRSEQFASAFGEMFKFFRSEKALQALNRDIASGANYALMREHGLALTDLGTALTTREERFMSNLAEKIPGIGKIIRASGRAYVGFLNKLRVDVFNDLLGKARTLGIDETDKFLDDLTDFINTATGRGKLPGKLENTAVALNSVFFSPRLMASRINLLNPAFYISKEPFVRKEALKSLFTFAGAAFIILGLAALAGLKVGTDWRSSDFAKIKIKNTRIDILAGFQQYIRMAGQLITGEYVSSVTGKVFTLGEGYKPITRFDILLRQLENKEAPVASFITALLRQKTFMGEDINVTKEIAERFTPMVLSDLVEMAKTNPKLLPLGILGLFGVGIQTYEKKFTRSKR